MKKLILVLLFASLSSFSQKDLTISNVMEEIQKNEIVADTIVLQQVILETGFLKSYGATKRNNLFGFWNSKAQEYFVFEKWEDSVKYYKKWQDKKYKGGDYYEFLKSVGYATDLDYIWKLRHIKI